MKAVYDDTKMYLSDWFPGLPSYPAFNNRPCFLADTLREFSVMLGESLPYEAEVKTYLMIPCLLVWQREYGAIRPAWLMSFATKDIAVPNRYPYLNPRSCGKSVNDLIYP